MVNAVERTNHVGLSLLQHIVTDLSTAVPFEPVVSLRAFIKAVPDQHPEPNREKLWRECVFTVHSQNSPAEHLQITFPGTRPFLLSDGQSIAARVRVNGPWESPVSHASSGKPVLEALLPFTNMLASIVQAAVTTGDFDSSDLELFHSSVATAVAESLGELGLRSSFTRIDVIRTDEPGENIVRSFHFPQEKLARSTRSSGSRKIVLDRVELSTEDAPSESEHAIESDDGQARTSELNEDATSVSPAKRVNTAYIALGSNVGDRVEALEAACRAMRDDPDIHITQTSPLYETEPMYVEEQERFLNGVCEITTTLEPIALLDKLQAIEKQLGRVKVIEKGPRRIDLDILLYSEPGTGSRVVKSERLTIPHPLMTEREFVLRPLVRFVAPS